MPRLLLCQNHPCADIALAVRVLCVAAHRIEASPPTLFTDKDFASCKTPGALPLDPAAYPQGGRKLLCFGAGPLFGLKLRADGVVVGNTGAVHRLCVYVV